ncbi:glycoside hydrolase family 57 [Gammaproteobacteria bacterium]|jgi:hypothetical protein|nr:glycoside hydrolase family 57 [Gammaproteobacteria bacterium]
MKPKGYLVFHLNLAFSSIEEDSRADVIKSCYHSLLDLIEQTGVPIGIELTGWTLKQIERIDSSWIERFKNLLSSGKCELVGSGYCQIIGPLVPSTVNNWNQRLGLDVYKSTLGCRPNIILVNEMAFSSSLIDLYSKFNYSGVITDRDNMRTALNLESTPISTVPNYAEGPGGAVLPILWSDSILFQKVQHFAHGDIAIKEYVDYLKGRINDGESIFPIYTNDAEVFDYRPGRFEEERPTHPEGEWNRLKILLEAIVFDTDIEFCSPSHALQVVNGIADKSTFLLADAAYPIPVKKQAKYNIARWAVSGRDDFWLNTMCHRIEKHLVESQNNNHNDWRELCELWASDLRTHITDKRWARAKSQLSSVLFQHGISDTFGSSQALRGKHNTLMDAIGNYGDAVIELSPEEKVLSISTKNIKLELNLRRGLTINNLAFSSHEMEPCIGTLPHGHFGSISLGADYYSGGVIVELPFERERVTDLEKVHPRFRLKDNGNIEVSVEINTKFGSIIKVVEVSIDKEQVSLSYDFPSWDKLTGSVRVGIMTLINQFSNDETIKIACSNGGEIDEIFDLSGEFDHTKPPSTRVSSSRGLGATAGEIKISNNGNVINFNWDPSECAVMPLLQKTSSNGKYLSRLLFAMKEIDDSAKFPSNIGRFSLSIAAS